MKNLSSNYTSLKISLVVSATFFLFAVFSSYDAFSVPSNKATSSSKAVPGQPAAAKRSYDGNPQSIELNERGAAAIKAKDFRTAEELLVKAITIDPNNLTAVYNLAGAYLVDKKESAALSLLEGTVKTHQDDAGIYVRLGDAYFATKDVTHAIGAYENVLKLDSGYPGVAAKLSTAYLLDNRPHEAEKLLIVATQQDPKNAVLLANLSSLYLGNGKTNLAVTAAKRALQLRPNKDVYVTLGTAYEMSHDYKNALIAFQRAQDLGDERPELKKKIDGLKQAVS